jgi:hypothetical protein
MFNLEKGDILFCDSNLVINGDISQRSFDDLFSEMVVFKDTVSEKYTHYCCWFKLEKDIYIYSSVSFCDERLYVVELFPQDQSTNKETSRPYTKELKEAQQLAFEWYSRYFNQSELSYTWGRIKYCEGSDPIYRPPCIVIEYYNKVDEGDSK